MIKENLEKTDWLEQSKLLLQNACTPHGIRASLTDLDNYNAVFTRDAVMAGIAGILLKDKIIIEGLKNSLIHLKELQGKQGQIASNFSTKDGTIYHVSYGTLSPKYDSCTWYLIGVGLLIKESIIKKEEYKKSIEKTINLLDGIEFNGKHLMYVPKGGNWADEYDYEGYILYDQVLRAWALSLLASIYDNTEWAEKSKAILSCIEAKYTDSENDYLNASFGPGGAFRKFDLAAHALLAIVFGKKHAFIEKSLNWIIQTFIDKGKFPPAFYPVIMEDDKEWESLRKYHLFEFKNKPHHYHNGGIWFIWIGWLSMALSIWDKKEALEKLQNTSFEYLNSFVNFEFSEYIAADNLSPHGTKQLCYTATGIIFLLLTKGACDGVTLKNKLNVKH